MQEPSSDWITLTSESIAGFASQVIDYLPSLIAAILIIAVGWLVGRLARRIVRRALNGINRFLDRIFQRGALAGARMSTASMAILAEVTFWIILFLTVTISARIAGLSAVAAWLDQIVTHLPNLLLGGAIIVIGYVVSVLLGEHVAATARAAKSTQSIFIGKLAQSAIFLTALILGLGQIGVDVTLLIALFAIAIGAVFVGFSIAFGLGAKVFVGNLIGARNAQKQMQPETIVRIGDIEGEILEITATHIAIDTEQGRMLIPGHLADQQIVAFISSPSVAESVDD